MSGYVWAWGVGIVVVLVAGVLGLLYWMGYSNEPTCQSPREMHRPKLVPDTPLRSVQSHATHLVSYAHGVGFEAIARANHQRMAPWFQSMTILGRSDLDADFQQRNREILAIKEGAGLWVWKPQVMAQRWAQLSVGDVLVYLDGGLYLESYPVQIIERCVGSESGIWVNVSDVTHMVPLGVRSKGAIFRASSVPMTDTFCAQPGIEVGLMVLHKRSEALPPFLQDWLHLCQIPGMLSTTGHMEGPHPRHFRANYANHDMSIASVLAWHHEVEIAMAPPLWRRAHSGQPQKNYRAHRWWQRTRLALQDGAQQVRNTFQ